MSLWFLQLAEVSVPSLRGGLAETGEESVWESADHDDADNGDTN